MNVVATHVAVFIDGDRRNISCECEGHRYHVWLNRDLKPTDEVIYKNPPRGVALHTPGYYNTRRISLHAKFGAALFDHMKIVADAGDLWKKAALAEVERRQERARVEAAEALADLKRVEGPQLFALLAEVIRRDVLKDGCEELRRGIVQKLGQIDPGCLNG